MIESSDTQEPVVDTAIETASPIESSTQEEKASEPTSLKEKMQALSQKSEALEKPTEEVKAEAPVPAVEEQKPQYEPNWKYKAFGKEKEVPEFFRSLVKDSESEKQVKDVFTKADAFDSMKERYENTSQQFQKVSQDYVGLDKDVRRVTSFLNNGDLDNFFASVKLNDQQIFDYVQKKLEILNMPPEQRQAFERQTQERQQIYQLQEQNNYLTQMHQNQAVQARTMQLDSVLSSPQVSGVASAWDQRSGQLGAFRDLVIQEGRLQHALTGQDAPVEQVVQNVLSKFGKFVEQPQAVIPAAQASAPLAQAPSAPQAQVAPETPVVQQKPVIPAIAGRGTAPVQKKYSLKELQKMGKKISYGEDINI